MHTTDLTLDPKATYTFDCISVPGAPGSPWSLALREGHDETGKRLRLTGTPLELAEILTNAGDRILYNAPLPWFEDFSYDQQGVIDRLTNVAAHITNASASADEQLPEGEEPFDCDNGCGDGLGRMDAGYSFMENAWKYSLRFGCTGHRHGSSATREGLVKLLADLHENLGSDSLKDVVKSVIDQLK